MAKKAQSILEYALIISVVVAALGAMNIYVQRSIQANLKLIEEQINTGPNPYESTGGGFN
ncbi:MAG: hypothetical protein NT066_05870 [Candidatus Omnitrophica bacterium]|nr:hypothetical protein [Candidatus Omnitrophota bacterium]